MVHLKITSFSIFTSKIASSQYDPKRPRLRVFFPVNLAKLFKEANFKNTSKEMVSLKSYSK